VEAAGRLRQRWCEELHLTMMVTNRWRVSTAAAAVVLVKSMRPVVAWMHLRRPMLTPAMVTKA